MIITSSTELRELTGSFSSGVDFESVQSDIEMESMTVIDFIGEDVYQKALSLYRGGSKGDELVRLVQRPIALLATLRYLQANMVSHDEIGRKFQVDKDGEERITEWMAERDDNARLQKAYKAIDQLIAYLEKNQVEEWLKSDQYIQRSELVVPSLADFERWYYIDHSYRFYYILVPIIRQCQTILFSSEINGDYLEDATAAVVFKTMAMALNRFSLKVLPSGIVQSFTPSNQSIRATQVATEKAIEKAIQNLESQSLEYLSRYKLNINSGGNPYVGYNPMPGNSIKNKFVRL